MVLEKWAAEKASADLERVLAINPANRDAKVPMPPPSIPMPPLPPPHPFRYISE